MSDFRPLCPPHPQPYGQLFVIFFGVRSTLYYFLSFFAFFLSFLYFFLFCPLCLSIFLSFCLSVCPSFRLSVFLHLTLIGCFQCYMWDGCDGMVIIGAFGATKVITQFKYRTKQFWGKKLKMYKSDSNPKPSIK